MKGNILIVEDEFIVASDLRIILETAGYRVCGIAASVEKAMDCMLVKKPDLVFLDIKLTGPLNGIDLAFRLNEMEIPFIFVSANSNQDILELAKSTNPYGFLVKPFRAGDVLVTLDIAIYRHEHNLETKLVRELWLQTEISKILGLRTGWKDKLLQILAPFQKHIAFDYFSVCWENTTQYGNDFVSFYKGGNQEFEPLTLDMLAERTGRTRDELYSAIACTTPLLYAKDYSGQAFEDMIAGYPFRQWISGTFGLGSALIVPLDLPGRGCLVYSFYSRGVQTYQQEQVVLIDRLQVMLVRIAEHILNNDQAPVRSDEKDRPVPESDPDMGLVGSGISLAAVKRQISIVAPFDMAVLILGETGTGKDRAAQAIHRLSSRRGQPIIKINCAAIPASLMESELFGHERGAFTGALGRRIGKFEQAIGGSIFLDEIGELSPDLQSKLLSVLQEKEIVRLGSNQAIKTDVRIIAATNRNLEKEVAEGRFRLDLYYRLKVFPIELPPLRERREDIAELAAFFLKSISKKLNRNVSVISERMMEVFMNYDWPGNIRELENLMERGVLLTSGDVLVDFDLPRQVIPETGYHHPDPRIKTMKEVEKEHILAALKKCKEKINGVGGAAELLDMPPTTLLTKMNKLGIIKRFTIE